MGSQHELRGPSISSPVMHVTLQTAALFPWLKITSLLVHLMPGLVLVGGRTQDASLRQPKHSNL